MYAGIPRGNGKRLPILPRRTYHKFSRMTGSRFSLFFVQKRAFKIFNKESKQDKYSTKKLLKKCFSVSKFSDFSTKTSKFNSLPYYGHVTFWIDFSSSKRKISNLNYLIKFSNDYICIFCGTTIFDNII